MKAIIKVALISLCIFSISLKALELDPYIKDSIYTVMPTAKGLNGDVNLFSELTKPMAPLDLNIKKSKGQFNDSDTKNIFYGVMGSIAGLNNDFYKSTLKEFFEKYQGEKTFTNAKMTSKDASAILKVFKEHEEIEVIATWSKNSYRVNNIFINDNRVEIFDCSKSIYFPCSNKKILAIEKLDSNTKNIVYSAKQIAVEMQKISLVALIKNSDGVRAIIDGVSDNEIGIFYSNQKKPSPTSFPDGKDIVWLREIDDNVVLYAAN